MANGDDQAKRLQQLYQQQQPNVNLGSAALPPVPTAPVDQQQQIANLMSQALANVNQAPQTGVTSPSGGTATPNTALNTVQSMQQGASAGRAQQPTDLGATIAQALAQDESAGQAKAIEAQRKPADVAAYNQVQRNIQAQQEADVAAAQPTASLSQVMARNAQVPSSQQLAGQNPLVPTAGPPSPEQAVVDRMNPLDVLASGFGGGGASPLASAAYGTQHGVDVGGGRRLTALPSGGVAVTGAPTAAARAETERRKDIIDRLPPVQAGLFRYNTATGAPTPTTGELMRQLTEGQAETARNVAYQRRFRSRPQRTVTSGYNL
jgi:hypothetical protein